MKLGSLSCSLSLEEKKREMESKEKYVKNRQERQKEKKAAEVFCRVCAVERGRKISHRKELFTGI